MRQSQSHPMLDASRLVTADELERYPEDDYRYELVGGRLVRMSPVGFDHGRIVMQFGSRLQRYVSARRLGVILTEVGFTLARNPDTVRAPDIAFIRAERLASGAPRGFVKGPPDLAVEVLSPEDTSTQVRDKVEEYLTHAVPLVLVVDPETKAVTAHRRLSPPVTHAAASDLVDLSDAVPGFRCTVRDIFE